MVGNSVDDALGVIFVVIAAVSELASDAMRSEAKCRNTIKQSSSWRPCPPMMAICYTPESERVEAGTSQSIGAGSSGAAGEQPQRSVGLGGDKERKQAALL